MFNKSQVFRVSVKSFTLIEIIVVMIISGAVVTISTLTYEIIQKQYFVFKAHMNKTSTDVLLVTLINKDFMLSDAVQSSEEGMIIKNQKQNIQYLLLKDKIIRQANLIDTFKLENVHYFSYFLGKEMKEPGKIIDELKIESGPPDGLKKLHFYKQYGADEIMEGENMNTTLN